MKRLNISAFFLACLLFLVFEGSAPEQGADHCEVRYAKHPRVFLDVSPIAIQRVLDALYCTFLCTDNVRCLSFNVKVKPGADNNLECRLLDTANYSAPHLLNSSEEFDHYSIRTPCESSPCQNGGTCHRVYGNPQQYKCNCTADFSDGNHCEHCRGKSCEDIARTVPTVTDGVHWMEPRVQDGQAFKAHCDMTIDKKGWTLIARFSNNDAKNWMKNSGEYWYDRTSAFGQTTDPADNTDMISPAFWLVTGTEFKITRSDDPSHTALLQTMGGCLGGQTFRSKMISYGDFRGGKVWASDKCRGKCEVQYGGQYKYYTKGFLGAECDGSLQQGNKIGFWCDSGNKGSVMMIGGGDANCGRADYGIGITEADEASFVHDQEAEFQPGKEDEYDYGDGAWEVNPSMLPTYALNMWVR